MGNKANSNIMRKRMVEPSSHWFSFGVREFSYCLHRDFSIRNCIKKNVDPKILSKVSVSFEGQKKEGVKVSILTCRPGTIIGKQGSDIEKLKKAIKALDPRNINISIDVIDVGSQDLDAQLVASRIAAGITQRKSAKRVMKEAVMRSMLAGAKGIKIICSGRHGREIAADEKSQAGSVPLQTFSANIEHYKLQAPTTMGTMGVKVWISREKKNIMHTDKKNRGRGDDQKNRRSFERNDKRKTSVAAAA